MRLTRQSYCSVNFVEKVVRLNILEGMTNYLFYVECIYLVCDRIHRRVNVYCFPLVLQFFFVSV